MFVLRPSSRAQAKVHRTVAFNLSNPISECHIKKEHHSDGVVFLFGGPDRIRTDDPYNANVMRSQLRYRPIRMGVSVTIIPPSQIFVKLEISDCLILKFLYFSDIIKL